MSDDDNVLPIRAPKKPWSEERKAAWRAKVAKSNNKPAGGAGWGGPARGASSTAGDLTEARAAPRRTPEQRAAEAEEMRDLLAKIAKDENQAAMARIMAADKFLDRTEGKAVARQINADAADEDAVRVIERRIVDVRDPAPTKANG